VRKRTKGAPRARFSEPMSTSALYCRARLLALDGDDIAQPDGREYQAISVCNLHVSPYRFVFGDRRGDELSCAMNRLLARLFQIGKFRPFRVAMEYLTLANVQIIARHHALLRRASWQPGCGGIVAYESRLRQWKTLYGVAPI
jgi:hypothetical protein